MLLMAKGSKSRIRMAARLSEFVALWRRCRATAEISTVAMITERVTDGDRPVTNAKAQRAAIVSGATAPRPKATLSGSSTSANSEAMMPTWSPLRASRWASPAREKSSRKSAGMAEASPSKVVVRNSFVEGFIELRSMSSERRSLMRAAAAITPVASLISNNCSGTTIACRSMLLRRSDAATSNSSGWAKRDCGCARRALKRRRCAGAISGLNEVKAMDALIPPRLRTRPRLSLVSRILTVSSWLVPDSFTATTSAVSVRLRPASSAASLRWSPIPAAVAPTATAAKRIAATRRRNRAAATIATAKANAMTTA